MILRAATITTLLSTLWTVSADLVPEITTLADGHNYIAKLPCIDCPFLHRDEPNGPWTTRNDENALLLNISLPWDATHLSLNGAALLTRSSTQPRIYAAQVPLDYSTDSLSQLISNDSLDTAGPLLGLSYGTSLHHPINSSALVYRFNVFAAHFPLSNDGILASFPLEASAQQVLELVFLPRPLHSPADLKWLKWEIISARLSARERSGSKHRMRMMLFAEWDQYGHKGSPWHAVMSALGGVVGYAARGIWQMGLAILGFLVVFVVGIVLGVLWFEGDAAWEKQGEKGRRKESVSWKDVETGRGGGDVVKSD